MSELINFILDYEDAFKSKARLASLYADFARSKTTNPDGYHANVQAWTSALAHASRAGMTPSTINSRLSIHAGSQLEKELESKSFGRPVALGAVIDEGVKAGDLIPLQDFLQSTASIYRKPGWIPEFHIPTAWQIAQWGLRKVGLGGNFELAEGDYVVKANVETASTELLRQLSKTISSTPTSTVYSLETFNHAFSELLHPSQTLSSSDARILLTHLSRDLHACTISWPSAESNLTIIKFKQPGSYKPSSSLTTQDTTIAQLSTLLLSLSTQTDALNARLGALEISIRASVAASKTNPASKERILAFLRTRKALTTTLVRRQASIYQIESVLHSIDDAATQVDMVRAMQDSSAVLRDLNKQVGGVEGVEKVMDSLRDDMEGVEEVGKVLAEGNLNDVDEGEVEDELEALVQDEKSKEEKIKQEEKARKEAVPPAEVQRKEETPENWKEDNYTSELDERMPSVPKTGFGPIERRRQRIEEEAQIEKALSGTSLDPKKPSEDENLPLKEAEILQT